MIKAQVNRNQELTPHFYITNSLSYYMVDTIFTYATGAISGDQTLLPSGMYDGLQCIANEITSNTHIGTTYESFTFKAALKRWGSDPQTATFGFSIYTGSVGSSTKTLQHTSSTITGTSITVGSWNFYEFTISGLTHTLSAGDVFAIRLVTEGNSSTSNRVGGGISTSSTTNENKNTLPSDSSTWTDSATQIYVSQLTGVEGSPPSTGLLLPPPQAILRI